MAGSPIEFPKREDAALVTRVPFVPAGSREWTGNDATDRQHHGLVSLNEVPCYLRLLWRSADGGETVEVGQYKLGLRALAAAGFVQEKGKQVRLRFVRGDDGTVAIQSNDGSPWLPVGRVEFGRRG